MARVSAPDLLALLTLRLRTLADLETIATATGLTGDSTAEALSGLAQRGWVRHRDGRLEGWMLTPDGRDACAAQLAAELDAAGARADVLAAYQRFLSVNQRLLDLCTDWQLRDGESTEATASVVTDLEHVDAVGQAACRRPRHVARSLRRLLDEAGRGPRRGRSRRARLADRPHHRLVPHGLVRAAREPARDPGPRAGRCGRVRPEHSAGGALMPRFGSLITAMVTPFDRDGRDRPRGRGGAGAHGWSSTATTASWSTGTTGEASVLTDDEQVEVWRAVSEPRSTSRSSRARAPTTRPTPSSSPARPAERRAWTACSW